MRNDYKRLGDYIEQVNIRNDDEKVDLLLGVNLDKIFIKSVANTVGTDMSKYKIIKKGQFGCKLMSVGRDRRLPISRLVKYEKALISSAYYVFEVSDESILNPEYLMMWFLRSESDRYLWFQSGGDIRGRITWGEFCTLPIKIPPIEKQREIVAEYNAVDNRIRINEQLNQKLEETAQAIYKEWFVDFNFPITSESCPELVSGSPELVGQPYKSSGGKMVYNEELKREIPEGWEAGKLPDLINVKYGKAYAHLKEGNIPLYGSGGLMKRVNKALYEKPSVLIPRKGTLTNIMHVTEPFWCVDTMFYSILKNEVNGYYTFYILKQLDFEALNQGSAVPSMTTALLNDIQVILPIFNVLENFDKILKKINRNKFDNNSENRRLFKLKDLLLSKMSKVEVEKEIV